MLILASSSISRKNLLKNSDIKFIQLSSFFDESLIIEKNIKELALKLSFSKAEVIKKLENAGAVMIAKLSSGSLARGDTWYNGTTKNPWDLNQGSSGSSAGSASATSAGLVSFSIGTETLGSIISPSTRCGVTGLRPTYGTVSTNGFMTLSWSMDKVGPIARSSSDAAIVFNVIKYKDSLKQRPLKINSIKKC